MRKNLFFLTVLLAMFLFTTRVNAYENFRLTDEIVTTGTGVETYQIDYTGYDTDLIFKISQTFGVDFEEKVATITDTGELTLLQDGIVTVTVECKDDAKEGCNTFVSSSNLQLTVLVNKGGTHTVAFAAITEEFNTIKSELLLEAGKLTIEYLKTDFVKDLMTLSVDMLNDKGEKVGVYSNLGREYVFLSDRLPKDDLLADKGIKIGYRLKNDTVVTSLYLSTTVFEYDFEFGNTIKANIVGPTVEGPIVDIIYKEGVAADKKIVLDLAKTIPVFNKSYINADIFSKFSVESLSERQFNNSEAAKIIKDNKLDSYLDPRYGDSSPMSPFFSGLILLGKGGTYYTVQEIKVWSTLKLPKNASISTELNIKEYFETYLDGDYTIRVEKDENYTDVFRVFMKENKKLSYIDKILSLFIPRVYADEENVITFAVEEVNVTAPKEDNPQTGDNILLYSLVAGASLIGFAGGALYLNKRNKNKKAN